MGGNREKGEVSRKRFRKLGWIGQGVGEVLVKTVTTDERERWRDGMRGYSVVELEPHIENEEGSGDEKQEWGTHESGDATGRVLFSVPGFPAIVSESIRDDDIRWTKEDKEQLTSFDQKHVWQGKTEAEGRQMLREGAQLLRGR